MGCIGRLRDLGKKLRHRWHGHLEIRLADQQEAFADLAARLESIEHKLTALSNLDELLKQRLAEQMSDLQDHLQFNAASIVAQIGEQAAAQAAEAGAFRPFTRKPPTSEKAA